MGRVVIRGAAAREKVVEILRGGGSIEGAAAATGYGKDYVRQIGAKNGLRFYKGEPKTTKHERAKRISDLYLCGKDPKEIVAMLGIKSTSSVYYALRECGVSLRKKVKRIAITEFRICKECGSVFYCDDRSNKFFCSARCQKVHLHKYYDPVRRARKNTALIDADITLDQVARLDNDICYLCGEKVNWNDYKIINGKKCACGQYPSIDHVVALRNGGAHSWDNVRLAHISCNASKGVGAFG